jgi:hypothetical protein
MSKEIREKEAKKYETALYKGIPLTRRIKILSNRDELPLKAPPPRKAPINSKVIKKEEKLTNFETGNR